MVLGLQIGKMSLPATMQSHLTGIDWNSHITYPQPRSPSGRPLFLRESPSFCLTDMSAGILVFDTAVCGDIWN
jgi:hypothetical protein